MPEVVALNLTEAEPVLLDLDEPEGMTLTLVEDVVALEVVGEIGPRGLPGETGLQGEQGIQGPPGPDAYFRHVQGAPSASWLVQHDLGYRPAVSVEDSAGSIVYGDVRHIDENSLVITFDVAFGGYANLS